MCIKYFLHLKSSGHEILRGENVNEAIGISGNIPAAARPGEKCCSPKETDEPCHLTKPQKKATRFFRWHLTFTRKQESVLLLSMDGYAQSHTLHCFLFKNTLLFFSYIYSMLKPLSFNMLVTGAFHTVCVISSVN